MISAGEVSGDRIGAKLVEKIHEKRPEIEMYGMGGDYLRKKNVNIYVDVTDFSTVGFIEPVLYFPKLLHAFWIMKELLKTKRPDVLIVIDYQGFHMQLLKHAKKLGIPAAYFVAPQEWQWGTDEGGKLVSDHVTKVLAIFKQENEFYQRLGADVEFIGHPVRDLVVPEFSKEIVYRKLNIPKNNKLLALFPGSRKQELKYTAPHFIAAARCLQQNLSGLSVVISVVKPKWENQIKDMCEQQGLNDPILYTGNSHNLIEASDVSLVTSGTITLEHAVLAKPFITAYRFPDYSYWLTKKILGKRFKRLTYFSLPNMLLDEFVTPEFRQKDVNKDTLCEVGLRLFNDTVYYNYIQKKLKDVRDSLGAPGVFERAADAVLKIL
ncbi:lipid-A-disaccharide synthase [Thermoproteota archaeon]